MHFFSLNDLSERYDFILPDTSAILSSLDCSTNHSVMRSLSFWKEAISDSLVEGKKKYLFCKDIYSELENGKKVKSGKKSFRRERKKAKYTSSQNNFNDFSKISEFSLKRRKSLIKCIDENELLLDFLGHDEEIFLNLYEKYLPSLKCDFNGKSVGLNDYRFLISTFTFREIKDDSKKIAVVSNDFPMYALWSTLVGFERPFNFDFYRRISFDKFRKGFFV